MAAIRHLGFVLFEFGPQTALPLMGYSDRWRLTERLCYVRVEVVERVDGGDIGIWSV